MERNRDSRKKNKKQMLIRLINFILGIIIMLIGYVQLKLKEFKKADKKIRRQGA